jgi:spermidine/putrescine transport system permease protein
VFLLTPLIGIVAISFASRGIYGELQGRSRWRISNAFSVLDFLDSSRCIRGSCRVVWRWRGDNGSLHPGCSSARLFHCGVAWKIQATGLDAGGHPVLTNLLIRTYAWQMVFSGSGWLARAAAGSDSSHRRSAYPSAFAVFIGLSCDYLPFLALPLYASVEKIDWASPRPASDLGAAGWRVFWHALLP